MFTLAARLLTALFWATRLIGAALRCAPVFATFLFSHLVFPLWWRTTSAVLIPTIFYHTPIIATATIFYAEVYTNCLIFVKLTVATHISPIPLPNKRGR